eukprot:g5479.t1
MAPRVAWFLLGLVVALFSSARAITSTSTSDISSDPSCVTVQVAAASTARSDADCPAVLVAVTLTASTEDCASDLEMLMVIEEYPRDVRTYGGESTAALDDKSITWTAPSLSVGTDLSVEFKVDFCDYCEKYDGGRFNPIDSFQYDDAEGNEPNDRKMGYKLKIDCVGIDGEPVDTIVATPEPTPSPTAAAVATVSPDSVGATAAPYDEAEAEATTLPSSASSAEAAPASGTAAPVPATTSSPAMTQAPAMTEAPAGETTAPGMTLAPDGTTAAPAMTQPPTAIPDQVMTQAPAMAEEGAYMPTSTATSSESMRDVESSQGDEEEVSAEDSELERRSSDDDDDDEPSGDDGSGDSSAIASASTVAPTIAGTEGTSRGAFLTEAPTPAPSRGAFFTEAPTFAPTTAPTSASTAAPTSFGGGSSQGVTLEIQSIFEARRRALATDVSDHTLERRGLAAVTEGDADEYDDTMAGVCAAMVGLGKESVIAVSTDFGPDGPAEDSARRGLMTSSSSGEGAGTTATQLTPITTCEVDLSGLAETRAVSAAILVDRMMKPENFVLVVDENRFGPVNAVVSSVSFWQNGCSDQTCPATGDGSFASVYPLNDAENQRSISGDDHSDEEQRIFWFVVLAAGLVMAAVFSWCCFCLCCAASSKRQRKPKRTLEDKYSVKSPPKGGPVVAEISPPKPRRQRFAGPPSPTNDTLSGSSLPGPSPTTPPAPRQRSQRSGRRRAPLPHLSMSPAGISAAGSSANAAGLVEPLSPGEADWRNKFGLGPLRDYAYRSAPVSPRRTPSSTSGGSTGLSSTGDPFCATYRDHVVAAADGQVGGKLRLPPLMDDATAAMESQSAWQMTDEINSSVQHTNDPVVRSSLGKAGMVIANALSSPRRELNRLKEALNRPTRQGSCTATSPTVTASSLDPSSAPGFGGSEGGFSPQMTLGSGSHFNSSSHLNSAAGHFNNVSSPIYEIDLEADENGEPAAAAGAAAGHAGGSKERGAKSLVAEGSAVGDGGGHGTRDSPSHETSSVASTPSRASRKSGRNMFAKAPGSTSHSRSGSSHGAPSSPSARSVATDNGDAAGSGSGPFSVLEKAAAAAEVKVGVHSPTGRAVQAFANSSRNGGSGDEYDGSVEGSVRAGGGGGDDRGSVDEPPPNMSPLPTGGGASGRAEASRAAAVAAAAATAMAMSNGNSTKPDADEGAGAGKVASPAPSPRKASAAPFGGVLSGFGCMAPQISPRAGGAPKISPRAGSRLPEIEDDDMDLDEDDDMDLTEDSHNVQAAIAAEVGARGSPYSSTSASTSASASSSSSPLPGLPAYPETSAERLERVGEGAGSASTPGMTLEAAIAKSRSRIITPDLTPIAELAENDFFTDSETESELSSRASSVSSSRSRRRVPRDPAALLAAAMEKAGQVAAIPPPSAGSPGQVGRPLSAVEEVPMEAVALPGLGLADAEVDDLTPPHPGTEDFQSGGSIITTTTISSPPPPSGRAPVTPKDSVGTAVAPIPRPAQRPAGQESPSGEHGVEGVRLAGLGSAAAAAATSASAYFHNNPSPARSRQEEEDEQKEHELWEKAMAMEEQKKAGSAEGGAPKLDSPSAVPTSAIALERADTATAAAAAPDAPAGQTAPIKAAGAPKPPAFKLEAPKLPGFSLMGALASFLGKKDNEAPAPVVAAEEEEETEEAEETVTINVPPELGSRSTASEFTESPESHTLELRPDAIVEKPPKSCKSSKSSLDEGFVDVPITEAVEKQLEASLDGGCVDTPTAEVVEKQLGSLSLDDGCVDPPVAKEVVEQPPKSSPGDGFVDATTAEVVRAADAEKPRGVADIMLPGLVSPADLPVLVLPAEKTDGCSQPAQRIFSRVSMNLQSPGMDTPKGFDPAVASMPDLPKPPSPTSSAVSSMKTPSTIANPARISDASPMYDRAAIARAMSQAAEEADLDGDSDIVMPVGAWPSERRQNSYNGSNSGISDVTSSSGSSGHGTSSSSGGSSSGSSSTTTSSSGGQYTSSDVSDRPL